MSVVAQNFSQWEHVATLYHISDEETVSSSSESKSSTLVKDLLLHANETLRIDRRLIEVVKNPTPITLFHLLYSAMTWTAVMTTIKVAGITAGLFQLTAMVFLHPIFNGFGKNIALKFKQVIERIDHSYYPKETMLRNITLGVLAQPAASLYMSLAYSGANALMRALRPFPKSKQVVVKLMSQPGYMGLIWATYSSFIAPPLEEFCIRGILTDTMHLQEADHSGLKENVTSSNLKSTERFTATRLKTMLISSIIFGIMHLNYTQGLANILRLANIPLVAALTCMGFMYSLLTEATGDLWAATAGHAIYNLSVAIRARYLS